MNKEQAFNEFFISDCDEVYDAKNDIISFGNHVVHQTFKGVYIACSAIHFDDEKKYEHQPINIESGFVVTGHRHHNCFMTVYIINKYKALKNIKEIQGFLTSDNRFVDRFDAAKIAYTCGQTKELKKRLFSEDIY